MKLAGQLKVSPVSLNAVSASGEGLESETAEEVEVGLVAKVPFIMQGGFGAGRSLLQQSAATRGF